VPYQPFQSVQIPKEPTYWAQVHPAAVVEEEEVEEEEVNPAMRLWRSG